MQGCLDVTTPGCACCKDNCLQPRCVAVCHPLCYLLRCPVLYNSQSCCVIVSNQLFALFVGFVLLSLLLTVCSKSPLPTCFFTRRTLKSKSFRYKRSTMLGPKPVTVTYCRSPKWLHRVLKKVHFPLPLTLSSIVEASSLNPAA